MIGRVRRLFGAVAEALRHEHHECGTPRYEQADELGAGWVYRLPVCHCGAAMPTTIVPVSEVRPVAVAGMGR